MTKNRMKNTCNGGLTPITSERKKGYGEKMDDVSSQVTPNIDDNSLQHIMTPPFMVTREFHELLTS